MQHEVALVPDQIEDAAEVDPLQRRDAVMVLCGVRDVHEYRIRSSAENAVVAGGSAFNVRAESLRLGDFTEPEVRALLAQHTAETGQAFTEVFRKKGIEVLLLYDRIDEWVLAHLDAFDGKPLQSVAKGDLDLGGAVADSEAEAKRRRETEDAFKPVVERVRRALGSKAKAVRLTDRLTESPACLVADQDGISANLERVLRAAGQAVPNAPLVLELNPDHPIVARLKDEADDARVQDWSHVLFDQALLAEGGQLDDPAGSVKRLNELMLALAGEPKSRIWTPGAINSV